MIQPSWLPVAFSSLRALAIALAQSLFLLINVDELAQRLHAVVRILGEFGEQLLGAIEQTCAHVVLRQLQQSFGALRGRSGNRER